LAAILSAVPAKRQTTFSVPKMDCPSEERLIRLALADEPAVTELRFDLDARTVAVKHSGVPVPILNRLERLGLGAAIVGSFEAGSDDDRPATNPAAERRVLSWLLLINAAMFVGELGFGFAAQSTGLIADSLDMLADATVYGLSLYAVGHAVGRQKRAARASGVMQALLAAGVMAEVGRRAITGSEPVEAMMIGVAVVALIANLACVALLAAHRQGGVHMRASWIFSTNDALANLGVIVAGVLVMVTGSAVPDLMIGTIIAGIVLSGAIRILRMGAGDEPTV
jgi:Co/Zn/Cd efflux system component